jgi:hypothetical protein
MSGGSIYKDASYLAVLSVKVSILMVVVKWLSNEKVNNSLYLIPSDGISGLGGRYALTPSAVLSG